MVFTISSYIWGISFSQPNLANYVRDYASKHLTDKQFFD